MKVFELLNEKMNRNFQRLIIASKGVRSEFASGRSLELNKHLKNKKNQDPAHIKKLKKLKKYEASLDLNSENFEIDQIHDDFKKIKVQKV